MEITYIAHSCFKIKGNDVSIVIDPYDPIKTGYKLPKLEADLVLSTHNHFDHNYVEGVYNVHLLINKAGEFESKDVFVYGFQTFHDEKNGEERGKNIIYLIEIDGLTILHVGDLGHELSQETLENLPGIDILMIPVGGTYTLDVSTAVSVISQLEPSIIIPMHYKQSGGLGDLENLNGIEKFLNEFGVENPTKTDKLKIKSKADLPIDTSVILLEPAAI